MPDRPSDASALDRRPFVISANTLRLASLEERLSAAVSAGFSGIGLRLDDYRALRRRGWSDDRIRSTIDDAGLSVVELESNWDWVLGSLDSDSEASAEQAELLHAGEALHVRQINAPSFFTHPLTAIVDGFAKLCDQAAARGLLVGLEFMPYAQVSHLTFAWQVVSDAARANGGVLIDAWHYFRSGSQLSQLAVVPPEKITSVQLSDVSEQARADLANESRHHRVLPGTGVGQLDELLGALSEAGYGGPVSVEIFSDALDLLTPLEAAQRSADAARAVLTGTGWSLKGHA